MNNSDKFHLSGYEFFGLCFLSSLGCITIADTLHSLWCPAACIHQCLCR